MTDMITPASLRAHADWLRGRNLNGSASSIEAEAARLEAESARDEEAEQVGKAALQRWVEVSGSGEVATFADVHREVGAAAIAALAADGRLLPEGGTVLTEEQVADLRWLMAQYVGFNGDIDCPPYASLDALFTPPAVSVPDSGSDGTPEKPWPTAADVPDGVWFRSARNEDWKSRWLRCGKGSSDYADMANPKPTTFGYQVWDASAVNDFAPFVRVDGDKA